MPPVVQEGWEESDGCPAAGASKGVKQVGQEAVLRGGLARNQWLDQEQEEGWVQPRTELPLCWVPRPGRRGGDGKPEGGVVRSRRGTQFFAQIGMSGMRIDGANSRGASGDQCGSRMGCQQ